MNRLDRSALGDALAERVISLARTTQRLQALEDYREPNDHVVGQPDAEAVLRRALLVLSSHEAFERARRITAGEHVAAGDDFAHAGLVIWDPGSDSMRPTPLLTELIRVFESAVREAELER
ncbi:MAG: hypothetical protein ACHQ4F_16890 [Candidatus Dormibacteria bacterium]